MSGKSERLYNIGRAADADNNHARAISGGTLRRSQFARPVEPLDSVYLIATESASAILP
jgi:hypothetical protein